jgi:hypothetical protein
MNKQPWYHRAVILFTATEELDVSEFDEIIKKKLKDKVIIKGSAECEEIDAEPGDPADLI